MTEEDAPLLWERTGQKPMLLCPWCLKWAPQDSFILLQMPPSHNDELVPIYKHGGVDGCKHLFALRGDE